VAGRYNMTPEQIKQTWDWLWSIEHKLPLWMRIEVRWRYLVDMWHRGVIWCLERWYGCARPTK